MKKNKAEKGIIVIINIVGIIFLLLTTCQMIEDYGKVKDEKEQYDAYIKRNEDYDETSSDEILKPIRSSIPSTSLPELLLRDVIKFSLRSAQICLILALILFIIWFIICSVKKEIKFKEGMTVIGITLMLFIIVSYVVFIADFGVEG